MGRWLSFKGSTLRLYHLSEDKKYYKILRGLRQLFNCNHPVVRGFSSDSLRYWATRMGVDGFRFRFWRRSSAAISVQRGAINAHSVSGTIAFRGRRRSKRKPSTPSGSPQYAKESLTTPRTR